MRRTAALLLAAFLLLATAASAQVVYERHDPVTGRTTIAYRNGDGSLTYEVYDVYGWLLHRGVVEGSAYSRRRRAERVTTPAPQFGIPVPREPNRVVQNPFTGGTLQSHPNPGGTRTVVEVDPRGNVRTYVVPGD